MKTLKITFILLLVLSLITIASCSEDDIIQDRPAAKVQNADKSHLNINVQATGDDGAEVDETAKGG